MLTKVKINKEAMKINITVQKADLTTKQLN